MSLSVLNCKKIIFLVIIFDLFSSKDIKTSAKQDTFNWKKIV